jgi:hypothetical protein
VPRLAVVAVKTFMAGWLLGLTVILSVAINFASS